MCTHIHTYTHTLSLSHTHTHMAQGTLGDTPDKFVEGVAHECLQQRPLAGLFYPCTRPLLTSLLRALRTNACNVEGVAHDFKGGAHDVKGVAHECRQRPLAAFLLKKKILHV